MYRFNDSLPIEAETIQNSHRSLRDNSTYLKQLRFSHKCISTLERVSDLQAYIKSEVPKASSTQEKLSLLIESYLLTVLYTSSITNPSRTYRSPHYLRRQDLISNSKHQPPEAYLEEIALSNLRTWGGMYGMPSYALHLIPDYSHYTNPSTTADKVTSYYLKELSTNPYWRAIATYPHLKDEEQIDIGVYNLTHYLITEDEDILSCYLIMAFLSEFIPNSLDYYEKNYESMQQGDYLLDICHLFISMGLDKEQSNLHYKFIHQSLDSVWDELFIEIIRLRKRAASLQPSTPDLIRSFIDSISITTEESLYKRSSNKILSYLGKPGGFNMYLMLIASTLLNRAYILLQMDEVSLSRVNRLTYLAAITLRKSNLSHIQKIGNNILYLTRQTNLPKSTDLLT